MSDSEDSRTPGPVVGFGPVIESLEKNIRSDIYEIPRSDKILVIRNPLTVGYPSLNPKIIEEDANEILTSKKVQKEDKYKRKSNGC
jgi:uncharacterized protein with HEPN domain